jgi:phosphoglycolate phosphatase-like HAD superfamily hydrolase
MHICLFDIDGTLILTGGAGQSAFAHTLSQLFDVPEINRDVVFSGRSDRAIAMEFFRVHEIPPTQENWQRFCRGYLECLNEMLATHDGHVLPGVHALLDALEARGDVAVGLLTGNLHEGARRKLSFYGLWQHFPFGGFGDEHEDRNEIAAVALRKARRHLQSNQIGGREGEAPAEPNSERANGSVRASPFRFVRDHRDTLVSSPAHKVIVIGDTLHDVRCGQSIGALCVAVATGHSTTDVLRTGQPDVAVESLEDLEPVLALLER